MISIVILALLEALVDEMVIMVEKVVTKMFLKEKENCELDS
jgi:hypothetical protein